MISKIVRCVLLFSCLCAAEKACGRLKILVHMSSLGYSLMQFQGRIADELANAGHEVKRSQIFDILTTCPGNPGKVCVTIATTKLICNSQLVSNTELFNQLKGEKYDVVIAELYGGCIYGYSHAIGGRVKIATSAVPSPNAAAYNLGIPSFSSYVISGFAPSLLGTNMKFFERFVNFINELIEYSRIKEQNFYLQQPLFNKAFGPSFPSLREIVKNVSLLFVNSNEFLAHSRPISSKIIHIGGIVQTTLTNTIAEKHVKEILDNSKSGAILVSFGTSADESKMSMEMRKGFVEAFRQFPAYDFIWKYEPSSQDQSESELLATAPNVHTVKWVEQRAILAHQKLKVFITHARMNSINEATHAGKPMVVIPLFADQFYNAMLVKPRGIGEHVEIRSTTNSQFLIDALSKVLNDPSYAKNAQVLCRKLELTPFSSAEKLVKWVEFAAQFPNQLTELNLPDTEELGWFVFYSLDVICASFALILIAMLFVFVSFRCLLRVIRNIYLSRKCAKNRNV